MMGCGASSTAVVRDSHTLPKPHSEKLTLTNGDAHPLDFSLNGFHDSPPTSVSSIEPSSDALQQFLELETIISDGEKKFQSETFHVKAEQNEQLEQMMAQLAIAKDQAIADASKLRSQLRLNEIKTTKDFLMRTSSNNNNESTDQEKKLLDLLNRQEIAEREYAAVIKQRDNIKQDMEMMKKKGERLNNLHAKRDEILDAIFEGQYGSDVEQAIEKELDWLLEQKHHVDQASFRWKESLILADQAFSQMGRALEKWKKIPVATDFDKKYSAAIDTRNLLVSANQNIYASLRYLPNIEVPYCNQEEMDVLDKAIRYIFVDMQSPDRHEHATSCFHTTYKRIGALKQWLSQVINTTIQRDLLEVQETCGAKAAELRNERVRLIKQRLKHTLGRDSKDLIADTPDSTIHRTRESGKSTITRVPTDSGFDSELEESVGTDELRRLFSQGSSSTPDPTPRPLIMPTPVPSADLAPLPTTDEIFGKIEVLRKRHNQELNEFTRNLRLNQAKMSQGLKDKLNKRRSRRSRLEMHSRQQEALEALKEN